MKEHTALREWRTDLVDEASKGRFGPYRLDACVGIGGMASVYRAWDPSGRPVALKRLLPGLRQKRGYRKLFEHEARIGAELDHPAIPSIVDRGELSGVPYLVFEYIEAVPWARLLSAARQQGKPCPPDTALYLVWDALGALSYVHRAFDSNGLWLRIVHGDATPSNFLIDPKGSVKLIDFGIATSVWGPEGSYHSSIRGKPGYMAPEQILGEPLDRRSDLFTLGVVLAELLLGERLFRGTNELEVMTRNYRVDLSALDSVGLPEPMQRLLSSALGRMPRERFQDAEHFLAAVEGTAEELGFSLGDESLHSYLSTLGLAPAKSGVHAIHVRPVRDSAEPVEEVVSAASVRRSEHPIDEPTRRSLAGLSGGAGSTDSAADEPSLGRASSAPPEVGGGRLGRPFWMAQPAPPFGRRIERRAAGDGSPGEALWRIVERIAIGDIDAHDRIAPGGGVARPLQENRMLRRIWEERALAGPGQLSRLAWRRGAERFQLPGVLLRLMLRGPTGVLVARCDGSERRIYLHRGEIVRVASTEREELLGARLVSRGLVDAKAVEFAAEYGVLSGQRLGETLVQLGHISAALLLRELVNQLRDRFIALGKWGVGQLALHRAGIRWWTVPGLFNSDPTKLIVQMMREHYAEEEAASWLTPYEGCHLVHGPVASSCLPEQLRRACALLPTRSVWQLARRVEESDVAPPGMSARFTHLLLSSGVVSAVDASSTR